MTCERMRIAYAIALPTAYANAIATASCTYIQTYKQTKDYGSEVIIHRSLSREEAG